MGRSTLAVAYEDSGTGDEQWTFWYGYIEHEEEDANQKLIQSLQTKQLVWNLGSNVLVFICPSTCNRIHIDKR